MCASSAECTVVLLSSYPAEKKTLFQNYLCTCRSPLGAFSGGQLALGCLSSLLLCFLKDFWRDWCLVLVRPSLVHVHAQTGPSFWGLKQEGSKLGLGCSHPPLMRSLELNCHCLSSVVLEAGLSSAHKSSNCPYACGGRISSL